MKGKLAQNNEKTQIQNFVSQFEFSPFTLIYVHVQLIDYVTSKATFLIEQQKVKLTILDQIGF